MHSAAPGRAKDPTGQGSGDEVPSRQKKLAGQNKQPSVPSRLRVQTQGQSPRVEVFRTRQRQRQTRATPNQPLPRQSAERAEVSPIHAAWTRGVGQREADFSQTTGTPGSERAVAAFFVKSHDSQVRAPSKGGFKVVFEVLAGKGKARVFGLYLHAAGAFKTLCVDACFANPRNKRGIPLLSTKENRGSRRHRQSAHTFSSCKKQIKGSSCPPLRGSELMLRVPKRT